MVNFRKHYLAMFIALGVLGFALGCSSPEPKVITPQAAPLPAFDQPVVMAPEAPPLTPLHHEVHWTYEGETGPLAWADLKPEFASCARGQQQSPVDLIWKRPTQPGQLEIHYAPTAYSIENNGHTIVVYVPAGQYAVIRGERYELLQFHFHATSEHTISGRSYPMEIHFVHKNQKGDLGVIGVMIEEGDSPNPSINSLWQSLPLEKGKTVEVTGRVFSPGDLLPKIYTFYQYMGSLTTPPCSEGVLWTVFNTPVKWSRQQIDQFRQHYHNNNRPTQPLNGRGVTNY